MTRARRRSIPIQSPTNEKSQFIFFARARQARGKERHTSFLSYDHHAHQVALGVGTILINLIFSNGGIKFRFHLFLKFVPFHTPLGPGARTCWVWWSWSCGSTAACVTLYPLVLLYYFAPVRHPLPCLSFFPPHGLGLKDGLSCSIECARPPLRAQINPTSASFFWPPRPFGVRGAGNNTLSPVYVVVFTS